MTHLKYNSFVELLNASEKYSEKFTKRHPEVLARKLMHQNLLRIAKEEREKHNYEVAYEHLFKLMECVTFLINKDKNHYATLFGPDLKNAIGMAEELKLKLDIMYAEKQKVKLPKKEENIQYRNSIRDLLADGKVSSNESEMISTANLYTALKSTENNLNILMVDLRPAREFEVSHISQKLMTVPVNIINCPGEILKSGLGAGSLASSMETKYRKIFGERGSFDQIILIDASNNYEKINILKDILLKYDEIAYKNGSIKVLTDGYKAWVDAYDTSEDSNGYGLDECSSALIQVNYDDILYENDEISNTSLEAREIASKKCPVVDRSSKVHALQKYEELSKMKHQNENEGALHYGELRKRKEEEIDEEMNEELRKFYLDEKQSLKKEVDDIGVVQVETRETNGIRVKTNDSDSATNEPYQVAALVPTINRSTKPRRKCREPPIIGVSPGLTGLKNLGNTCYMNSILQCISNNSDLMEYFSSNVYKHDINRNHRTRGEVAHNVARVVHHLWVGNHKVYAARDLKNVVGNFKTEYKSSEQQDSHEFLTFLMDWLHNDLNKVDPAPIQDMDSSSSDMDKAWIKFQVKNKSQISKLFYGLQKSTVSCLACKEQSATYEPFSNLSLSIPNLDHVKLEQCIEEYFRGEQISGWRCPKCKKEQPAERKTELCKLPVMLVIHLKRFGFYEVQSTKRTTNVNFPLANLDLRSIDDDQHKSYSLYGVSNHYGTMETGHYTAFCKNYQHSKWYRFDDHEVSELSDHQVVTPAAYILFYSSNGPFMASS